MGSLRIGGVEIEHDPANRQVNSGVLRAAARKRVQRYCCMAVSQEAKTPSLAL